MYVLNRWCTENDMISDVFYFIYSTENEEQPKSILMKIYLKESWIFFKTVTFHRSALNTDGSSALPRQMH